MFTPRLTIPEKDNKYYIAKSAGGLNPGIAKPAGSPLRFANCVFYALGRFAELWGVWMKSTNAENFCTVAKEMGLTVSQTPALGAIICWAKGKVGDGSDGAGHVAVVEIINTSGSIVSSESGWGAKKEFWTTTRKNDGNWGQSSAYRFLGFILPPGTVQPAKTRAMREGDRGDDVLQLQKVLQERGYFSAQVSPTGYFGLLTLGAVLAFQFKSGLEVDGVCGPKTQAALSS